MSDKVSDSLNMQTFMIVWDINLENIKEPATIVVYTPSFSLNPNGIENTTWIRLLKKDNSLNITSNIEGLERSNRNTYLINQKTQQVFRIDRFNGYSMNHHEWSDNMKFVFELEIKCDASRVQPTIWKRYITTMKPAINKNAKLLNIATGKSTHKVLSNRGLACLVQKDTTRQKQVIHVFPEYRCPNGWDLLTVMSRKLENNALEWHYIQTTSRLSHRYDTYSVIGFCPFNSLEIHDVLCAYRENMSAYEITAITSVIKPNMMPAICKKDLQPLKITAKRDEYFTINKSCDITVLVGDQKIRAHKKILSTGSKIWRNLDNKDEIVVDDFEFETVQQMIEYMYTGIVKPPTESTVQLLKAAEIYGVSGLKDVCVERLSAMSINMNNAVTLLVLADRCNIDILFDKVLVYVRENYAVFTKSKDTMLLFELNPELALKLFTKMMENFINLN